MNWYTIWIFPELSSSISLCILSSCDKLDSILVNSLMKLLPKDKLFSNELAVLDLCVYDDLDGNIEVDVIVLFLIVFKLLSRVKFLISCLHTGQYTDVVNHVFKAFVLKQWPQAIIWLTLLSFSNSSCVIGQESFIGLSILESF